MMEIYKIILPSSGRSVQVCVERKKMKTCRLKVYPNAEVKFSVSMDTATDWISEFLSGKSTWIEKKLDLFEKTTSYASTVEIQNGMSIKILGLDHIFSIKKSNKEYAFVENKILHIGCLNVADTDRIQSIFDKWWRKEALSFYQAYLDQLFPIVGKYNVLKPKIFVRKMKTLWGSCSSARNTIYLNQYLYKAKPACIEYVVLHELVHLLYPNHSRSFYDFLSTHMPDWKERKRTLDFDVVHGV